MPATAFTMVPMAMLLIAVFCVCELAPIVTESAPAAVLFLPIILAPTLSGVKSQITQSCPVTDAMCTKINAVNRIAFS